MSGRSLLLLLLSLRLLLSFRFNYIKMINYDDCIGSEKACYIDRVCLRSHSSDDPIMFTLNHLKPEELRHDVGCSGFTVRKISRLSYEFEMQGRGDLSIEYKAYFKFGCTFPSADAPDKGEIDTGTFFSSPLARKESYQVNGEVPVPSQYEPSTTQFNYCRFSLQTYGEDFYYDLGSMGPVFKSKDFPEGKFTGNRSLQKWHSKVNSDSRNPPFWEVFYFPIALYTTIILLFVTYFFGNRIIMRLRGKLHHSQRLERRGEEESKEVGNTAKTPMEVTAIDPSEDNEGVIPTESKVESKATETEKKEETKKEGTETEKKEETKGTETERKEEAKGTAGSSLKRKTAK